MKTGDKNPGKELYKQLRELSWDELWNQEVSRFNQATPQERIARVAVVRAVGVVFSECGNPEQKGAVKTWLRDLLQDPSEKIRRYAMAAIPKIGGGATEEAELLALLRTTTEEREKKFLGNALDKIGGAATLEQASALLPQTEQKVRASVARSQTPSSIQADRVLAEFKGLRIHLRGRVGLERIVQDEVAEYIRKHGKFRLGEVTRGLVTLFPVAPFSLSDIYALRCFGTVGFVPGIVQDRSIETTAAIITSDLARRVFKTFTEGSIRYRLNFVDKGHQRGAVRLLANRAYAMCPELLNDAREAPWAIDIHPSQHGDSVELRPRFDPRFSYRQEDVPAASHPPLAACMAWVAGTAEQEIIWDPFCGSGLELIERALRGGVDQVYGSDRSEEAIAITQSNFASAGAGAVPSKFVCCDFRDFASVAGLRPNSISLIITNPPMGKRIPIRNLHGLIEDLFSVAAKVLRVGGRLVFANPLQVESPLLRLQSRQLVDFGGFNCRLEMYRKV